jgi:putative transposase
MPNHVTLVDLAVDPLRSKPPTRPEFPAKRFADLDQARAWAAAFVHWYNVEHHHSGIVYVSTAARHAGDDVALLAARHALHTQARERNPARWSRNTRDWSHIGVVTLKPERAAVIAAHLTVTDKQPLAA